MKDEFVYLYLTSDNIKSFECLQTGEDCALSANAFLVMLLAASVSAWCADCFDIKDYNKFTNSDDNAKTIKHSLNISDRNYNDAIRELVKGGLMYKNKRNVYTLNPWIIAHGEAKDIQKHREYCYQKGLFSPPLFGWREVITDSDKQQLEEELNTDPAKQKHACVYTGNFKNFACFNTVFGGKRINVTELVLFFHFATVCQFVKYPNSIELNNIITRNTKELDKLAELLQLKKRAVQYAINNLVSTLLLHKVEGENGKYIINPYIAAKGTKDKIKAYQANLSQHHEYFQSMVNGDILYNNNNVINVYSGEVKEDTTL